VSFLALVVIAVLAGALAGLADAVFAVALGWGAQSLVGLLVMGTSIGAVAALAAALPFAVIALLAVRPRDDAHRLGWVVAWLGLAAPIVGVGRILYKRLPWSAGDAVVVVVVAAGFVVAAGLLTRWIALAIGPRSAGITRALVRLAIPAALLVLPAGLRIAGAIRAPAASRAGVAGGTNLLLLSIDTLRADALGVMGDPRARTPFLDRIARRSVVAANCVAPSPWTLPSLGSLLTGTYPGEHRVLQHLSGLSESVTTIADLCARADRRTAAFASNPWLGTRALERGFDEWDVAERLESLDAAAPTRIYQALSKIVLRGLRIDRAEVLTDRALSWLDRGDGAWFLWIHYFDPHLPNWPDPPWDRMFGPAPERIGSSLTVGEIRDEAWSGGEAERREIASLYFGEVAYTDHQLGRVWRHLETSDELASTAIAFTADHGEELWDHEDYGHGHSMFAEVVRVPLFLCPPGGTAGRILPTLTRLVDLAPTALALGEVDVGEAPPFTGENLLGDRPAPRATFGEALLYGDELKFLQTDRWKLIHRPAKAGVTAETRLYDLEADPAEQTDVAGLEPGVADTLSAHLALWMEAVGTGGAGVAPDSESLDPALREQLKALGYID
jgi:arylsulfatase A-like enzyme